MPDVQGRYEISAHWGQVSRPRGGSRDAHSFYIDDKFVGTTIQDVKKNLPTGVTWKLVREACSEAKIWSYDIFHYLWEDETTGKWSYEQTRD